MRVVGSSVDIGDERAHYLSLPPPKLPVDVQHRILSVVQAILEESCFSFVKLKLPLLLKERDWTCAAAVELTGWLKIIKKHRKDLAYGSWSTTGEESFAKLISVVPQLRHAAVHRDHLKTDRFLELIYTAQMLADALQDKEGMVKLQNIRTELEAYITKMKHRLRLAKEETDSRLLEIEAQKKVLREKELLVQRSLAEQQNDISVNTGRALLESIHTILDPTKPNASSKFTSTFTCDEHAKHTGHTVFVGESDIESDEDRLQEAL